MCKKKIIRYVMFQGHLLQYDYANLEGKCLKEFQEINPDFILEMFDTSNNQTTKIALKYLKITTHKWQTNLEYL